MRVKNSKGFRSMGRINEKLKTKYIIKTFLCCNRGQKFTSKQLVDFILLNGLNSANTEMNQNAVARMINHDIQFGSVLGNVKCEKIDGRNHYWMESL